MRRNGELDGGPVRLPAQSPVPCPRPRTRSVATRANGPAPYARSRAAAVRPRDTGTGPAPAGPSPAGRAPAGWAPPEPVTPDPPRAEPHPLLTQSWLDLAFLHWPVEPSAVAPLLPHGTVPDTFDGTTYVGLVAFRMHRVGWLRLPGVPYLGSFPETNVRLYSVDRHGRRGVVFPSLDAARLIPVLVGRAGFGLRYVWSRMSVDRAVDSATGEGTVTYTSVRRGRGRGRARGAVRGARYEPRPAPAASGIVLRVGERSAEPEEIEHFLTARWGLHTTFLGRLLYVPITHPRWPLHRAELLSCTEDLTAAAGVPGPLGPPSSVLYSPGVPTRFGRPVPADRPDRTSSLDRTSGPDRPDGRTTGNTAAA